MDDQEKKDTETTAVGFTDWTALKKADFLIFYEEQLATIAPACRAVGISRQTFYNWRDSDPDFAEKVKEIDEMEIDFVEYALKKRIKEGDTTAQIFYLKTKGKERGYKEKQEVEHTTGEEGFKIEYIVPSPPKVEGAINENTADTQTA